METPKKRGESEGPYPPTALSLPVDPERNFGTFRYERAAHQNVTPLPQRTKGGERKVRSRKEFASNLSFLSRERSGGLAPSTPSKPIPFPPSSPPFPKKPKSNSRSLRGPRSSLGTVQINRHTGGKWPGRLRALGSAAPS